MPLRQVTHWSWLQTKNSVTTIECPPDLHITLKDLAGELNKQIEAKQVPVKAELCEVNWADTGLKQRRILVERTGENPYADTLWYLIGLDYEGLIAFVEEKVYLRPPVLADLPSLPAESPRKRKPPVAKPSTAYYTLLFILGGIFIFFGIIAGVSGQEIAGCGVFIVFFGIGFMILSRQQYKRYKSDMEKMDPAQVQQQQTEIDTWNKLAEKEQQTWDKAQQAREQAKQEQDKIVTKWFRQASEAVHLSRTDDALGRFTQAVATTVAQTVKVLFKDPELVRKEEDRLQALEEELKKREQEGFR